MNAVEKWTKISLFLSIFTLVFHVIWEVGETVYHVLKEPENYSVNYIKIFGRLPVKITPHELEYLICYYLFCAVPFILAFTTSVYNHYCLFWGAPGSSKFVTIRNSKFPVQCYEFDDALGQMASSTRVVSNC